MTIPISYGDLLCHNATIINFNVNSRRLFESTVWGIDSKFTQQCNVMLYVHADLWSLVPSRLQFLKSQTNH